MTQFEIDQSYATVHSLDEIRKQLAIRNKIEILKVKAQYGLLESDIEKVVAELEDEINYNN